MYCNIPSKKYYFYHMKISSLLLMLCLSCGLYAQQTPAKVTLEVLTNQASVIVQYPDSSLNTELRDSSGILLFRYIYETPQEEGISDDEVTEQITFNVKPNKSGKFVIKGKHLKAAQAAFYMGCFCLKRGTFAIKSGTIKGTKMNQTQWLIKMKVKVIVGKGENQQTRTEEINACYHIVGTN